MARRAFIDAQGWVALKHQNDRHFDAAHQTYQSLIVTRTRLITTNFVLDEAYTLLRREAGHHIAVELGEEVRASQILRVVHIGRNLQEEAWELFKSRDSTLNWSFTDCTSFIVMRRLQIQEAITFDHDFEQAGFVALLRRLSP
ncbi:MAG TPA: PIN domain-containing protein [Bacteroidota bacterium]|nr:PIN domain-containing protein [Bacteroidota bacterium]